MTTTRQIDASSPAFDLKGSALTLMVLYLFTADRERLAAQLQTMVATSSGFFRNAPLLIDASTLPLDNEEPELVLLVPQLRALGLVPVALRGGNAALQAQALEAGLGLLPPLRGEASSRPVSMTEAPALPSAESAPAPAPAPVVEESETPAIEDEVPVSPTVNVGTKVVTRTIRSGQRVVAAKGDLLVLGAVNVGAEILAAGNIHVYGPLRGRALAGIHGDVDARICALQFYPELVAVAGEYLLHDELAADQLGGAVVVTIAGEKLKVETIGAFAPSGT